MAAAPAEVLHATLIAARLPGRGWRGALLLGPSGAGKSDFALRALGESWRLVADDRVCVWASAGRPFGRAPGVLSGLMELRGQGMARRPPLSFTQIALAVRLRAPGERQPQPAFEAVAGLFLPTAEIAPFEASGPQRLLQMLRGATASL